MDAAKESLLAANRGFNRKHQEIAFRVQRAFFALTSLRGGIAVAQSVVDSARAVHESARSRLNNELATVPEVALARQQQARAIIPTVLFVTPKRIYEDGALTSSATPPCSGSPCGGAWVGRPADSPSPTQTKLAVQIDISF